MNNFLLKSLSYKLIRKNVYLCFDSSSSSTTTTTNNNNNNAKKVILSGLS